MKPLILLTFFTLIGCASKPLKPVQIQLYTPQNCYFVSNISFKSFEDAKRQVNDLGGDTLTRTSLETGDVYFCSLNKI